MAERQHVGFRSGGRALAAGLVGLLVCFLLASTTVEAKKKKRTSTLSGVVLSMEDEPLAGVAVQAVPTDGDDPDPAELTDDQGRFSFKLPAGLYVLKLSREGLVPVEQRIWLARGQEQSLRAQMLDASMGRRNAAIAAYNAAVAAHEEGDTPGAIRHLEESVAADSTFTDALSLLADLQFDRGAFAEAAAAAERYLKIEPDDRGMQTRAYLAYRQGGDRARVDEWRARLAETGAAGQLAVEVYNEGAEASRAGDADGALERFRAALDLDPALVEAYVGIASIQYNRSRYDDALAAVEEALARQPDHEKALRIRVLIHEARGDRTAAVAAVVAWGAVDAASAIDLLSGWADVDFRAGRRREAASALLAALEIEPDRAETHYMLGLVYAEDEPAKAREHLERFIALAPTAPEVASAKELLEKL